MSQRQRPSIRWRVRLVEVDFSWQRQFLHEAGHASASLALLDHTADIVVLNHVDHKGVRQKHARFRFDPGIQLPAPGLSVPPISEQKLLEKAKIIAAGGLAEAVFLGEASDGMTGDLVKIEQIVECLLVPQAIRDSIEREADADFPQTRNLLDEHREAVTRISNAGYSCFQRLDLGRQSDLDMTVVLPAEEVRRLFQGADPK